MTNIVPGSDSIVFRTKKDLVEHVLLAVIANKKRYVGTEWEMFFLNKNGSPISKDDGQRIFCHMGETLRLQGYKTSFSYENNLHGIPKMTALNIPDIGDITIEIGHQFEFGCSVSMDGDEILEKNEIFFNVANDAARSLGYVAVFSGHVPGYAALSAGGYNRCRQWEAHFQARFDVAAAIDAREVFHATASTQVTIDAGGENFHEFFKALLLLEPALSLFYRNSNRSYYAQRVHEQLIPSQKLPILDMWEAHAARSAIEILIERFLAMDVPFLPDETLSDRYRQEPLVNGSPPTVQSLMDKGRLTEKVVNNVGAFFMTRPAFRKLSAGQIEFRGVDSQKDPRTVAEVAERVTQITYNDVARKSLLDAYADLSVDDLRKLHNAATMEDFDEAMAIRVADFTVRDFVNDIISRSTPVLTRSSFVQTVPGFHISSR